jgi:hypothetical protein
MRSSFPRGPVWVLMLAIPFLLHCSADQGLSPSAKNANGAALLAPIGACCSADGSCQVLASDVCTSAGGAYQGDDTVCDPNPCPQPPPPIVDGACCHEDGSCLVLTAAACTTANGTYQGDATVCEPNPCPQPPPPALQGACCVERSEKCDRKETCRILTAGACAAAHGIYKGDSSGCDPNPCVRPRDEGCGLGFWKQNPDAWTATPYEPAASVGGIFTLPAAMQEMADDPLSRVLRYPCGNGAKGAAQLLLRTAVVTLLNASHPQIHFPMSPEEVISQVNTALGGHDRHRMMETEHRLRILNEKHCPLR